jgi:hypothetical protein
MTVEVIQASWGVMQRRPRHLAFHPHLISYQRLEEEGTTWICQLRCRLPLVRNGFEGNGFIMTSDLVVFRTASRKKFNSLLSRNCHKWQEIFRHVVQTSYREIVCRKKRIETSDSSQSRCMDLRTGSLSELESAGGSRDIIRLRLQLTHACW